MTRDVEAITEKALEAFWASVAEQAPEAASGDMDPGTVMHLGQVARAAVDLWLYYNVPDAEQQIP